MKFSEMLVPLKRELRSFTQTVGDLVAPRHCIVCGEASGAQYLCATCQETVELRTIYECCKICGKLPRAGERGFMYCSSCMKHPPAFDMARSATIYDGAIRDMILSLKYNQGTFLVRELVRLVEGCVLAAYSDEQIDAICPVPLFPVKERERGYNQSALIAKELSKRLKLPYMPQILERVRHTDTQTKLNLEARRENVAGAFISPEAEADYVYGRNILLVDDVFTTGATSSECAAVLKRNRAGRVIVVSIAREQ